MKKKKLQKIFLKHQTVLLNPLFENQIITKKRLKNCQITLKEVYFQLIKDYAKNHEFPQTNVKFYKYGRVLYFLIIQLLGRGAFGKVNLGLHILSGRLIAIKSFNKFSKETYRYLQKRSFLKLQKLYMINSYYYYIS